MQFTLGIDASNIRAGGGLTHLVEMLSALNVENYGFKKVIVWGGSHTLSKIKERPWLLKNHIPILDKNLLCRIFWQTFCLARNAKLMNCDAIFSPGGSFAGKFSPVIAMSQNLLPFENIELVRYAPRIRFIKFYILRYIQGRTFRNADGVIYLTNYAKKTVNDVIGRNKKLTMTIPHGLNSRFSSPPKPQFSIEKYSEINPYKILYVSIIDEYKHQWCVVEALAGLRKLGLPITLDLIGGSYKPSLKRLNRAIKKFDPTKNWVHYRGEIPFESLHSYYKEANLGLFASSCENMPNILLENMASGLPIACSNRGPMPEILRESGVYFNPESPADIAQAVLNLIMSPELRVKLSGKSYTSSFQYSWSKCSLETFTFIANIISKYKKD